MILKFLKIILKIIILKVILFYFKFIAHPKESK